MPRKQTGQSLRGVNHQPMETRGRLISSKPGLLKTARGQVRVIRYLLSKKFNWKEEWSDRELQTMAEICLIWDNSKDKQFRQKHERLHELLQVSLDRSLWESLSEVIKTWSVELGQRLLNHPREYFSEKRHLSDIFVVVKQVWSRVRPKAFIGVGYTDKGNCRFASKDGSPSWQEVATGRKIREESVERDLPGSGPWKPFWKSQFDRLGPPVPKTNWVRERITDQQKFFDRFVLSRPELQEVVYPFQF